MQPISKSLIELNLAGFVWKFSIKYIKRRGNQQAAANLNSYFFFSVIPYST